MCNTFALWEKCLDSSVGLTQIRVAQNLTSLLGFVPQLNLPKIRISLLGFVPQPNLPKMPGKVGWV